MKCNLTIAVIAAVQVLSSQGVAFSAHTVTDALRTLVNSDQIKLDTGKNVDHNKVRDIFTMLRDTELLKDVFSITHEDTRGYFWYTPSSARAAAVGQKAKQVRPVSTRNFSAPNATVNRIVSYVSSRGEVTAKQIQSSLNHFANLDCEQIIRLCQSSDKLAVALRSSPSKAVVMAI